MAGNRNEARAILKGEEHLIFFFLRVEWRNKIKENKLEGELLIVGGFCYFIDMLRITGLKQLDSAYFSTKQKIQIWGFEIKT